MLARIAELLMPDLVDEVIGALRGELERRSQTDPRTPLLAELANIEGQIGNLTEAITMGGNMPMLVQRLQMVDGQRRRVEEALEALPAS